MSKWIPAAGGDIIDTGAGQGVSADGIYKLLRGEMDLDRPFVFAAQTKVATHTATVQLRANVLGVVTNLGTALVPVFGTPTAGADEYTLTGEREIVVSGLVGTVYPEAIQ